MIDNLTGLPALPEGDWWEVRDRMVTGSSYIYGGTYTYKDGYEVVWWTPNKTLTKMVFERKHWYSLFKTYFEVYSAEPLVHARWKIKPAKTSDDHIDAKGVKEAAKQLVEHMAAASVTKSLTGKYPPKQL